MAILLFDGHCNLCNEGVKFIIKRDPSSRIRFASLQSSAGKRILEEIGIDSNYSESLVLVEEDNFSMNSNAVLKILSYLNGWERHLIFLSIFPSPFRDLIYRFVARNRYKWFGRQDECMLPTKEINNRFLKE